MKTTRRGFWDNLIHLKAACPDCNSAALAFFDHLVYGADNGYAAQPRMRYWTAGAEDYRVAKAWRNL